MLSSNRNNESCDVISNRDSEPSAGAEQSEESSEQLSYHIFG